MIKAAAVLLLLSCAPSRAQDPAPQPKNRYQWIAKLRSDVTSAMTRASLSKKQTQSLGKSVETLRLAVEAHANKIKFNEGEITKALGNIQKELSGSAFGPEDRDAIRHDLANIPRKEPKARPPRPMRPPPRIIRPRR